jgi:hypothetical protein
MEFSALRLLDEQWSKDVQEGRLPFDPVIARGIHRLYETWWEQVGNRLPDDNPDRLIALSVLAVDVRDVIDVMAEERTEGYTAHPLNEFRKGDRVEIFGLTTIRSAATAASKFGTVGSNPRGPDRVSIVRDGRKTAEQISKQFLRKIEKQ